MWEVLPSFPRFPGLNCSKVSCWRRSYAWTPHNTLCSQPVFSETLLLTYVNLTCVNVAPNATRQLAQCLHLSGASQLVDHGWLKRLWERSRSARLQRGAHSRGEKASVVTSRQTLTVIMKYSPCTVWTEEHTENVPSLALCKPSVSQTYHVCTHTLPPRDIWGLKGVKSSVVRLVLLCCVQPWAVVPHSKEAWSAAPMKWP